MTLMQFSAQRLTGTIPSLQDSILDSRFQHEMQSGLKHEMQSLLSSPKKLLAATSYEKSLTKVTMVVIGRCYSCGYHRSTVLSTAVELNLQVWGRDAALPLLPARLSRGPPYSARVVVHSSHVVYHLGWAATQWAATQHDQLIPSNRPSLECTDHVPAMYKQYVSSDAAAAVHDHMYVDASVQQQRYVYNHTQGC